MIGSRLRAWREHLQLTQPQLATLLDVHLSALKKYETNVNVPGGEVLARLADMGLNLTWVLTGRGDMLDRAANSAQEAPGVYAACAVNAPANKADADEFLTVPYYPYVYASCGSGAFPPEQEISTHLAFRRDFLQHLGVSPEDLAVIRVTGDSMEPKIEDGGHVLLRFDQNQPTEGIFLVRLLDSLILKRIQPLPGGILRLKSDNPAYDPFDIRPADLPDQEFKIIGRAIWYATLM